MRSNDTHVPALLSSNKHDLALDCLLSCEIVLASGEIVVASREENAELFWALRGAGANFGIVTSFTSQGYAWGDCWAGLLAYTPDKLNALIQSGNEFMTHMDSNFTLSTILGNFLPPNQVSGILAVVFHNGPQEQGEKISDPFWTWDPLMVNKHPQEPSDRHLFGGADFTLTLVNFTLFLTLEVRKIGDFF
ncbi:hypothetical protein NQ176_g6003 [Zarea fungicola]|uniref:Uncharacterized protein n=1 Tax=Zarea fungicola TaxID=93591 RepID=A0ACC1N7S5_9HYPO|nr:hypothetical protein NQ176_g6003 [Lecanicillium fungicola]